ncbi:MAG: ABC transporter permease subunit [Anaerolineae bacterium]|nr:ABC transporter permease subunit [Anaerolineae bacterium]
MTTNPNVLELSVEEAQERETVGLSLWQLAMRRLRRDRLTQIAIVIIALFTILSILAPVITTNILRVDYATTRLNDTFIFPGRPERLVYLPDQRLPSQGLLTVVVMDRQREYQQVFTEIEGSFLQQNADKAALQFFHASEELKSLSLFLNQDENSVARRVRFGEASEATAIDPGTYTVTIKPGTDEDGDPVTTLENVTVEAGQVLTLIMMGSEEGTESRALGLRAYTVDLGGLERGTARVQAVLAAQKLPERVGLELQNETITEDLTYGDAYVVERPSGRAHVAFFDINAPTHILGTDDLGRDQIARLLYAGQVSLGIGFFSAMLSVIIGVTLGIITGFYGGVIDDAINWLITTISSIPTLLLLLIIVAALSPGPGTLILVLGLLGWLGICRLVRGETFSIRAREYIVSARAIGAPVFRIMLVHILPNLLSVVIISMAINIGNLILTESALSFLGFGIKPPTPSWGNMLTNAQDFFRRGAHLVWPPGLMISVTVLCLYIVGDGLRDAFDPTLRN